MANDQVDVTDEDVQQAKDAREGQRPKRDKDTAKKAAAKQQSSK